MILRFNVSEQDEGRKVYSVLRNHFEISATLVRRLKNADAIRVDGETAFTDRVLHQGQTLTVDLALAEPECDVVPENGKIDILFENEGLLAVNKQPGILVHPSHARYMGTLANFAAGYLLASTGDGRCHSVGRLDRDTSGVVLFAKNSYMKYLASKAMMQGRKLYRAIVMGRPENDEGLIDMPIRRAQEGNMLRIAAPDGQSALTRYRLIKSAEIMSCQVSFLELELLTGRTHQIRVHCSTLGMPLLGDVLYNTRQSRELSYALGINAQALHASSAAFTEPLSKQEITINAPIVRDDMNKILNMF